MSEGTPRKHSLYDRFPALRRLGFSEREQKIPFVQQLSMSECGAACLTMTLGYHGRSVRLDEVRNILGSGRDATNAVAILEGAERFGLRGRGVKLEIDELELLEPGTILHWKFKHFVVFAALREAGVELVDPALGRVVVAMEDFKKHFTGVALLLEPGPDFETNPASSNPIWGYFRQMLRHGDLLRRLVVTSALVQLLALALPSLTGAVVDRVVPRSDYHLLGVLAAGMGTVTLFFLVSSMVRSHLLLHLKTHLDARMTLGFLDHLVALPYSFFQLRNAGDLNSRLNSNATIREILTSSTLSGLLDGLFVLLYLVLLLFASPTMGVLAMALGALQLVTFLVTRRRQAELASKSLQVDATCRSYQLELITGIETLKAMGVEHRAVEHYSNLYVDVLNVTLERGRLTASQDAVSGTFRLASPLIILAVGAMLVMNGALTLGTMLALSALATGFLIPLNNLVATANQLQTLGSYYERVQDVMAEPVEQDPRQPRPGQLLGGAISLDRVSFRYGTRGDLVVKEVSIQVNPGQLVAIVGSSGAGKSTLANLLVGLYLPTAGQVLYDGTALSTLDLRVVRRQLGIVLQNPVLFAGSVRNNVALASPEATLEEVIAACKLAQLHEDILAMPMGYDTVLADRGASLSGGQRQRLALARALVRKPSILLLDEATSAMDAVTEAKVLAGLRELRCTRIVIAHRLSTVRAADTILVMNRGELVESGTHAQLLALEGHYAALVAAQREQSPVAAGS